MAVPSLIDDVAAGGYVSYRLTEITKLPREQWPALATAAAEGQDVVCRFLAAAWQQGGADLFVEVMAYLKRVNRYTNAPGAIKNSPKLATSAGLERAALAAVDTDATRLAVLADSYPIIELWALVATAIRADAALLDRLDEAWGGHQEAGPGAAGGVYILAPTRPLGRQGALDRVHHRAAGAGAPELGRAGRADPGRQQHGGGAEPLRARRPRAAARRGPAAADQPVRRGCVGTRRAAAVGGAGRTRVAVVAHESEAGTLLAAAQAAGVHAETINRLVVLAADAAAAEQY